MCLYVCVCTGKLNSYQCLLIVCMVADMGHTNHCAPMSWQHHEYVTTNKQLHASRTLGQCLNATNSSGKNAYRTFLKYLSIVSIWLTYTTHA